MSTARPMPSANGVPRVLSISEAAADRLPPHSLDAERALLGSILLDHTRLEPVLRLLGDDPDVFYRDAHGLVWRAILAVHAQGAEVDFTTVMLELERRGQAERAGDLDGMKALEDAVGSTANAEHLAGVIREKARKRRAIIQAQRILDEAYADRLTSDQLIGFARERLDEIGDGAGEQAGDCATLEDVGRDLDDTASLWPGWIQRGAITAVVAEGGVGKTRAVVEWAARLYRGDPMPDGTPNPLPPGTRTLWLCFDRNWRGLLRTADQFGLPRAAILLPTRRDRPLWIPDFDHPGTMGLLRDLIIKHRPGFVAIDTLTYATGFNTAKANETKLALDPLMGVLAETQAACLALTHLNASGEILNRRLRERVRTEIKLSRPDPAQKDRLRLEVVKSDDRRPDPLGMTFHDASITYDSNPPTAPDQKPARGPKPTKAPGLAEWLWLFLQAGPAAIVDIVEAGRDAGLLKPPTADCPKPSISPLYAARDTIARLHPGWRVDELVTESARGKALKHWRLAREDEAAEGDPEGDGSFRDSPF